MRIVEGLGQQQLRFNNFKILGCRPIASVDHFVPEALGSADLVEEVPCGGDGKVIKVLNEFCFISLTVPLSLKTVRRTKLSLTLKALQLR